MWLALIVAVWWGVSFVKPVVLQNRIIPFKRFLAMAIAPFIFSKRKLTDKEKRHEYRHIQQQRWMSPPIFLIVYLLQFLNQYIFHKKTIYNSYHDTWFERDARIYESIHKNSPDLIG